MKPGGRDLFVACGVAATLLAAGLLLNRPERSAEEAPVAPAPGPPVRYQDRPIADRLSLWNNAYLALSWDIDPFFFVHPEDVTQADSLNVRIWDPDRGDAVRGRCERELRTTLADRGLAGTWKGPYFVCPPHPLEPGYGAAESQALTDPWGRPYRAFWYCPAAPGPRAGWTATDRRLIPEGDDGVLVVISGGPDGILLSCAADKSSPERAAATAPAVGKAGRADFARFDPFPPAVTQADPFQRVSRAWIEAVKRRQIAEYRRTYGRDP